MSVVRAVKPANHWLFKCSHRRSMALKSGAFESPCGPGARIALDAAFVLEKDDGLRVGEQGLELRDKVGAALFPEVVIGRQRPRAREALHPAMLVEVADQRAVAEFDLQGCGEMAGA